MNRKRSAPDALSRQHGMPEKSGIEGPAAGFYRIG
jgi:hypothetical protein